jgi:hypothetical protein
VIPKRNVNREEKKGPDALDFFFWICKNKKEAIKMII